MSQERKCNRRRFLGMAAMSIVGAELGMISSANAQSTKAKPAEVLDAAHASAKFVFPANFHTQEIQTDRTGLTERKSQNKSLFFRQNCAVSLKAASSWMHRPARPATAG